MVQNYTQRQLWIQGARLRTLPAAIAPVLVGAGAAVGIAPSGAAWWRSFFALVVSVALQVGVNYANDYSDGIRGTDEQRIGPMRLVGSGAMPARQVKMAAFGCFAIAGASGLVIAATTSWWLIVVGLVCMLAAWGYTGGPMPYGYSGLGELFVFIFFGIVATTGTTYAITQSITLESFIAACAIGSLACALLVVNNLRDIAGDAAAGKRTLAVRLGDRSTRGLYVMLLLIAAVAMLIASVQRPIAAVGIVGLAVAVPAIITVRKGASGRDLVAVLGMTGRAQLVTAVFLACGLAMGG